MVVETKSFCCVVEQAYQKLREMKNRFSQSFDIWTQSSIQSCFHTFILSYFHTFILSYFHTIMLSYFHTIIDTFSNILTYEETMLLSLYQTMLLSYTLFFNLDPIFSYFHTFTLYNSKSNNLFETSEAFYLKKMHKYNPAYEQHITPRTL